jgi:predicted NUDIX family NTP pyrophosphohydrolase
MTAAKPVSAGLLMCRRAPEGWEFLLVHPGGPYFSKKDDGAWTIPKGLADANEELLEAARREFREETSFDPSAAHYYDLGVIVQKSGKRVHAWAFEGTCEPSALRSNQVEIEWPPRSGKRVPIPEVDRAAFYNAETAKRKILAAQAQLIDRALAALADPLAAP